MRYYKSTSRSRYKQETVFEREQRKKLHEILGDTSVDIIILALTWMQEEINKFQDKQAEFGDLTVRIKDIEPIKDFLRYG